LACKSHPQHCSSSKQLERCDGETRRSKAQRCAQQPAKNRPCGSALPPLPVCLPACLPACRPLAEDQERSTGPQTTTPRTLPHGPVLAWLPSPSGLARQDSHFTFGSSIPRFFFRFLLLSSFDVDAVILLPRRRRICSPPKLPLHSFSGHSLLDILNYPTPTRPDRPIFPSTIIARETLVQYEGWTSCCRCGDGCRCQCKGP
jgi:hypothetical protein